MTVMQKICSELNKKVDLMIEKNRIAAVRNRLKIAIAGQQKKIDKIYMEIGRECAGQGYLKGDEQFAAWYHQLDEARAAVERLADKMAALDKKEEERSNVISFSFGSEEGEEQPLEHVVEPSVHAEEVGLPEEEPEKNGKASEEDQAPEK